MQTKQAKPTVDDTDSSVMAPDDIETCFFITRYFIAKYNQEIKMGRRMLDWKKTGWNRKFTSIELSKIDGVNESPAGMELRLDGLRVRHGLIEDKKSNGIWSVTHKFIKLIADAALATQPKRLTVQAKMKARNTTAGSTITRTSFHQKTTAIAS